MRTCSRCNEQFDPPVYHMLDFYFQGHEVRSKAACGICEKCAESLLRDSEEAFQALPVQTRESLEPLRKLCVCPEGREPRCKHCRTAEGTMEEPCGAVLYDEMDAAAHANCRRCKEIDLRDEAHEALDAYLDYKDKDDHAEFLWAILKGSIYEARFPDWSLGAPAVEDGVPEKSDRCLPEV